MQIHNLAVQVPSWREDKGWHGLQEDEAQQMQQNSIRDSSCLPKAHVHTRHKYIPGPPGRLDMLVLFSSRSSSLQSSADLTHTQQV